MGGGGSVAAASPIGCAWASQGISADASPWGLGFRVQGSGFPFNGFRGSGFRVFLMRLRVRGLGFFEWV